MYYVPDGTKECGYYECKKCGNRFLSMQTMKRKFPVENPGNFRLCVGNTVRLKSTMRSVRTSHWRMCWIQQN